MQTIKTYTPEQLTNAEKMLSSLAALPKDEQRTAIMVANAFIEGMKAQERLTTSEEKNAPAR